MSSDGNSRGAAAFINNGGGTITFRLALSAIAVITLWLLQSFGSHIVNQLDTMAKAQSRMMATMATQAQQVTDTAQIATRNSSRLDDHEHRITILEVRQPK